ncbi:MAG: isoaspartyl peptidase/L-asparaginase family protein [Bacteroidales bacterium]
MKRVMKNFKMSDGQLRVVAGMLLMVVFFSLQVKAQESAISISVPQGKTDVSGRNWALVVHGGAGGPARGTMSETAEKAYLDKLEEALRLGSKILEGGGRSVDAVEAVVKFLEDCPLFNAGRGAVLNEKGRVELDAAIMDGSTGMAGAVACVSNIKNPVSAARLVMDKTKHVMLVGKGAEVFAGKMGLKPVDSTWFITPERLDAWKKWKSDAPSRDKEKQGELEKHGTVGAVALDMKGNLAAATSTGGLLGKMTGRVGDSPVIGAGTYANNNTCAVSATGQGEFFMRNVVAYDLAAMMEYRNASIEEAGNLLIMKKLENQKASGGLIAVDKNGNITMPFNTNLMFRGYMKSTGEREVAIY